MVSLHKKIKTNKLVFTLFLILKTKVFSLYCIEYLPLVIFFK